MNNINEKTVNRRTFKEVVITQLMQLSDKIEGQINRNLARAEFYKKQKGYAMEAARYENVANGLIDARHEVIYMKLDIETGGEL